MSFRTYTGNRRLAMALTLVRGQGVYSFQFLAGQSRFLEGWSRIPAGWKSSEVVLEPAADRDLEPRAKP